MWLLVPASFRLRRRFLAVSFDRIGTRLRPAGCLSYPPNHPEIEMTSPQELEAKFWKALDSDRVMMLGLEGVADLSPRPMTGLIENDHGPIWFFSARNNAIVEKLGSGAPALATFASKGN